MSDATVQVPAIGRVKRQYVVAGAALVAGIAVYAYWQRAQAPVDYPAYDDTDVMTDGVTDTAGGVAGGSANSGGAATDSSTSPDSDAEWARQAREVLAGAFDDAALATALGKYITRQGLSAVEQNMVRAAIGSLGYPPGGAYEIKSDTSGSPSTFQEPTGLRAVKVASTQVDLSWNKVPGASGYRIYRADLGDEPIGDSADTLFYARGLQPNRAYTFLVAARTGTGARGPKSQPLTVKTAAVKLGRPATPTVSKIGRTTVHVSTSKVPGAQYYRWYINGVAHGSSDGPSYDIQGLKPKTRYQVSVKADTTSQTPGPESGKRTFTTKK